MDLRGKVALVTGASRGIGAAAAIALAEAGCDVACAARSTKDSPQPTPGTLDDTVTRIEQLGRHALGVPTDLSDEQSTIDMVRTTVAHFGGIDVLINNAAITFPGDLELSMRRHDLVMTVNLRAPLVATREAWPVMKERGGGAIVNVSSAAAFAPYPGLMAYGVSKAGLERLTLDCARQLHPHGINVSCFRVDVPVASEGFLAHAPDLDHSDWEPPEVPAEGIVWMVRNDIAGRRIGMTQLRAEAGIMQSKAARPYAGATPPTEMLTTLELS